MDGIPPAYRTHTVRGKLLVILVTLCPPCLLRVMEIGSMEERKAKSE